WRPTTGWCTSPTSTPACRSTTSPTPATRTSPGTTSPTTPPSAAAPSRPSSSTRPKTSWPTAAASSTCPKPTPPSTPSPTPPARGNHERFRPAPASTAPVIPRHETDIPAPLDTVWNLHTDVDAWPAWNLEVTAAKLDGAFAPGNSFTWTSYGFTVTSTIYIVEDFSRTLWGGAAQGIMGIHEWQFAQSPAGVHVITTESFAGEPIDADPARMQTILDNSLTAWLTRLKQKAESSAHDSSPIQRRRSSRRA